MRFALIVALLLPATGLLSACGHKGPLYLRNSPPPGVKPAKPKPFEPVPYPRELREEEPQK